MPNVSSEIRPKQLHTARYMAMGWQWNGITKT
jgi:hypothetical protein